MPITEKIIGRQPINFGPWYAKEGGWEIKNRVNYFGSEFESKINNNTEPPAWLNEETQEVTFNTEKWEIISNGTDAWLASNKIHDLGYYEENSEYVRIIFDAEGKLICGIDKNGYVFIPFLNNSILNFLNSYFFELEDNEEWIKLVIDSEGKILEGIQKDGTKIENLNTLFNDSIFIKKDISINGNILKSENIEGKLSILLDKEGKIISYRDKNGIKHEEAGIEAPNMLKISDVENIVKQNINNNLNYGQECNIYSAARYYQYSGEGDFQTMLIADTHANNICIERAINVTNKIKSINCFIHLGDIIGWTPFDRLVNSYDCDGGGFDYLLKNILPKTCEKQWFIVPGNHDVGVTPYICFTRTDEEVYNSLIKPMIDNNILREGEYNQTGDYSDRCYYFHDFHNKKIRIISLYEYGWRQEVKENQYWEPVVYDSDAEQIKQNTTYIYDENNPIIVNCHNYKECSFKLKKTVTTIGASTNVFSDTLPRFKCVKGYQIFTKNQLEWLANTLNSTPDGYGIIILSHQALMENVNMPNYKFSCNSNPAFDGYNPRGSGKSYDQLTDNLVISKIINAWKNKTTLIEKVAAIPGYSLEEIGDPTYLNVLEDGDYKYMYEINFDFSSRTNNNAYFSCFINGHEHVDIIEQNKSFPYQLSIIVTCGNPPFRNGKDIASVSDINSKAYDCLTIFTQKDKERIVLCKYGNMRTTGAIERDFEIINPYNV